MERSRPSRKLMIFAPERTKNSRQHEVPLSRQALAIIERMPRRNSTDFLFGKRSGYSDWGRAKQQFDQGLGIAAYTLHDLRRSCATGMAELGVQPHIIEAVLNHVSGHKAGVAGIYNRAKYSGEMGEALQRWADHVDKITA
jgi:integrase